jgi:hypothetical protein
LDQEKQADRPGLHQSYKSLQLEFGQEGELIKNAKRHSVLGLFWRSTLVGFELTTDELRR